MAEVWDKRASEGTKAFAAFVVYRDMGNARTLEKAAKVVGKDVTLLRRWSARDDWVARVHQWDVYLDRENQQQQQKDRRDMLSRHARAMVALQELALKAIKEIQPEDLTTNDIVRYLDTAIRQERIARGVGVEEDKGKAAYIALWERLGGAPTGTEG